MSERTRREFLRDIGVGTGALLWSAYIDPKQLFAREHLPQILKNGVPLGKDNFFVAIVPVTGTIVITTHRAEMGQGIRSSLAAVLADELEADWGKVRLKQADAESEKYAIPFPVEVKAELPFPYQRVYKETPQYLIPVEGSQFTDSSRSMAAYFVPMRLFGAGIRLTFERAAAKLFHVDPSEVHAKQHRVYAGSHSIGYGDLLLLAEADKIPQVTFDEIQGALKQPKDWVFINKKMPFQDANDIVTGKPIYGADYRLDGMLTAVIERCPVANGRVKGFDAAAAMNVPGVRKVQRVLPLNVPAGGVGRRFLPHDGVAVIAENTWAALQGRRALRPSMEFDYPDDVAKANAQFDSDAFRQMLKESTTTTKGEGKVVRRTKSALADSDFVDGHVVEAEYYVPLLAQAPMEPPVATAVYKNGVMEMWAPTQNPELARQDVGRVVLSLPWDRDLTEDEKKKVRQTVTLHMPLLGGGFGRKSKPDYIIEAAFLAVQNPGVPIRVQWTREDDIKFSYFNSVSSQYLKANVDGTKTTALLQRSALTSFFGTLFPDTPEGARQRAETFNGGVYPYASAIERAQGLEDMPFDVPKLRIENTKAPNHIRVGWMRSVANIYHGFASGSFADELAEKAGMDPKEHLLALIGQGRVIPLADEGVAEFNNNTLPSVNIEVPVEGGKMKQLVPGYPPDTRKLRAVVEKVAEVSGWNAKRAQYKGTRRGLGIAAHRSFLSYVATVIDVSLSAANELTINDVYTVVDCGLAVNPDRVRAQMEGAVNYGLSIALLGEITAKNGAVVQNNFDDYPVLRMHQAPKNINVTIMEVPQTAPPTGIGEVGVPTVAPALANAIYAAGFGERLREIPFCKNKKLVIA